MNAVDPVTKQMATALGRIPSGLFIITLSRPGVETGMLASWVQQCSFSPPLISVAIQHGREIGNHLEKETPFILNILDDSQTDMISHFGRGFGPGESAFYGLEVERRDGFGTVLTEALGYLECSVEGRFSAGDHFLLVARVTGGRVLSEGQPMVHIRKNGLHY